MSRHGRFVVVEGLDADKLTNLVHCVEQVEDLEKVIPQLMLDF